MSRTTSARWFPPVVALALAVLIAPASVWAEDDPFGSGNSAEVNPFQAPGEEDPFGSAKTDADDAFGKNGATLNKPRQVREEVSKPVAAAPARSPKPQPLVRSGEDAILAALDEPTEIDFIEAPLTDVMDFLKSVHHIPIQLDRPATEVDERVSEHPVVDHAGGRPGAHDEPPRGGAHPPVNASFTRDQKPRPSSR